MQRKMSNQGLNERDDNARRGNSNSNVNSKLRGDYENKQPSKILKAKNQINNRLDILERM